MNFYRAQDDARKQTSWLVALFVLAVLALVVLTNLVVAIFVWYSDPSSILSAQPHVDQSQGLGKVWAIVTGLGWAKTLWISGLVCGVIGIATLFKWLSLRAGGAVVAESLGGSRILTNTDQADEKKLLNVVEEMALASGVPVPPVYVLKHEQGINAFAAGLSLKDAVIGVSEGCVRHLNREQLQGVIAHEFSHILNGDMRLNMRILAVLHGILMIGEAGRFFFELRPRRGYRSSRSDNKGAGAIVLLGLALMVLGWLGQFFGALIKSAVSRQREFLADASAVQFTRNPEGIAGALRLIGGHQTHSYVRHPNSHELGHLFFSQAFRSSWFATHPPLDDRIRAVLPNWSGDYLTPTIASSAPEPVDPMELMRAQFAGDQAPSRLHEGGAQHTPGATKPTQVSSPSDSSESFSMVSEYGDSESTWALSPALTALAHEPLDAAALCLALLLDRTVEIRAKQVGELQLHAAHWVKAVEECATHVEGLDMDVVLPLVDLMMPALKSLSLKQYQTLRSLMPLLIKADGRVDLLEWVLFELIRQHGDRHFGLEKSLKPKYKTPKSAAPLYTIVLSRLVYCGAESEVERSKSFGLASNIAGIYTAQLLPIEACSGATFTRAIHELSRAYPLLKPRLLKGLVQAAKSDGHLHSHERALIAAIALIWDCPVMGLE